MPKHPHRKKIYLLAILLVIGALAYALTAHAATRTGDGDGTEGTLASTQFSISNF